VPEIPPEFFRFGWRAPGYEASNWDAVDVGTGTVTCVAEGGTNTSTSARFWCSPIPDVGPLSVVVEWPSARLEERTLDLPFARVRAASDRSIKLRRN
jgi:hypothetical protein